MVSNSKVNALVVYERCALSNSECHMNHKHYTICQTFQVTLFSKHFHHRLTHYKHKKSLITPSRTQWFKICPIRSTKCLIRIDWKASPENVKRVSNRVRFSNSLPSSTEIKYDEFMVPFIPFILPWYIQTRSQDIRSKMIKIKKMNYK